MHIFPMRKFAHILVVALGCLVAVCLPSLSGKVVCSTTDGHLAVEPEHPKGSCDGEGHRTDGKGSAPQPCQDTQLDLDAMAARASDRAPSSWDLPLDLTSPWATPDLFATSIDIPACLSSPPTESPHNVLRAATGLRSVVLLI